MHTHLTHTQAHTHTHTGTHTYTHSAEQLAALAAVEVDAALAFGQLQLEVSEEAHSLTHTNSHAHTTDPNTVHYVFMCAQEGSGGRGV